MAGCLVYFSFLFFLLSSPHGAGVSFVVEQIPRSWLSFWSFPSVWNSLVILNQEAQRIGGARLRVVAEGSGSEFQSLKLYNHFSARWKMYHRYNGKKKNIRYCLRHAFTENNLQKPELSKDSKSSNSCLMPLFIFPTQDSETGKKDCSVVLLNVLLLVLNWKLNLHTHTPDVTQALKIHPFLWPCCTQVTEDSADKKMKACE